MSDRGKNEFIRLLFGTSITAGVSQVVSLKGAICVVHWLPE